MTDLAEALNYIYPNSMFVLRGDDLSGLEWLGPDPIPTQSQIDDAIAFLDQQKADAQALADQEESNKNTMESLARQAIATNRQAISMTNPTQTQLVNFVKELAQQNIYLIRLVTKLLDGTD